MSRMRSVWNTLLEGRFSSLLFSMLLLLLLQPFFYKFDFGMDLLRIFFFLTLVTALYSISDSKRRLTAGLVLVLVAVGAMGSSYITHETRLFDVGVLVFIFFSCCSSPSASCGMCSRLKRSLRRSFLALFASIS